MRQDVSQVCLVAGHQHPAEPADPGPGRQRAGQHGIAGLRAEQQHLQAVPPAVPESGGLPAGAGAGPSCRAPGCPENTGPHQQQVGTEIDMFTGVSASSSGH